MKVKVNLIAGGAILFLMLIIGCGGSDSYSDDNDEPDTNNDTVAPVITVLGDSPVTIGQGAEYVDAGATAMDDVDGEVEVSVSSTVDTATIGTYTVTYTASDSSNNEATAERTVIVVALNIGVFLDSPVGGIGYRTETQTGITDEEGHYDYLAGESVVFYIGDLEFPEVEADGVVTPENIAAGDETTQTNILQLLQTLDEDGNPENGISISQDTIDAFADSTLDVTSTDFDTEVVSTLDSLDSPVTLVTEEDANEHFGGSQQSQLIGSWLLSEGEGMRNILTFIDESNYIIFHEHDDSNPDCDDPEGCQTAGSGEYGSYTWDTTTKAFTSSVLGESDGSGGLSGMSALLTVNGETLNFDFGEDDGSVDFSRIASTSNSFVGSWFLGSSNDYNILTFLSGSEYLIVHNMNQESYSGVEVQGVSGEFGNYTLDSTGFSVEDVTVDTDGDGGVYDQNNIIPHGNRSLMLQEWGEIVLDNDDEGSVNFVSLGTFSVELYNNATQLGRITTRRDIEGFSAENVKNHTWQMSVALGESSTGVFEEELYELTLAENGAGTFEVKDGSDQVDNISWQINSVGDIVFTIVFSNGTAGLTFTIAKLNHAVDGSAAILLGTDEGSLWESELVNVGSQQLP